MSIKFKAKILGAATGALFSITSPTLAQKTIKTAQEVATRPTIIQDSLHSTYKLACFKNSAINTNIQISGQKDVTSWGIGIGVPNILSLNKSPKNSEQSKEFASLCIDMLGLKVEKNTKANNLRNHTFSGVAPRFNLRARIISGPIKKWTNSDLRLTNITDLAYGPKRAYGMDSALMHSTGRPSFKTTNPSFSKYQLSNYLGAILTKRMRNNTNLYLFGGLGKQHGQNFGIAYRGEIRKHFIRDFALFARVESPSVKVSPEISAGIIW